MEFGNLGEHGQKGTILGEHGQKGTILGEHGQKGTKTVPFCPWDIGIFETSPSDHAKKSGGKKSGGRCRDHGQKGMVNAASPSDHAEASPSDHAKPTDADYEAAGIPTHGYWGVWVPDKPVEEPQDRVFMEFKIAEPEDESSSDDDSDFEWEDEPEEDKSYLMQIPTLDMTPRPQPILPPLPLPPLPPTPGVDHEIMRKEIEYIQMMNR